MASIKVDVDFTYETYQLTDSKMILDKLGAFEKIPEVGGTPTFAATGQWDYDGTTEHFVIQIPEGPDKEERKGRPQSVRARPCEVLFDGETIAYHDFGRLLRVEAREFSSMPPLGPFAWWGLYTFPQNIKLSYSDARLARRRTTRAGHPTEVEVYHKTEPGGWSQLEVSYDPGLGFLPRFARGITVTESKIAYAKETYMIAARPCIAGGSVPTEWYEAWFDIEDFPSRYPEYNDDTELRPSGPVMLGHFKVTSFENRTTPVEMNHLATIVRIGAVGGGVSLKDKSKALTLDGIKSMLSKKRLTPPVQPKLAPIDEAELREFRSPLRRSWPSYLWAGVITLVVAASLFVGWRRLRMLALLPVLFVVSISSGCREEPIINLTAAFTQPRLLYDSNSTPISMTLAIKNGGNQAVRLFDASAGCSCRQVDRSHFPALLKPGERMDLLVQLQDRRQYEPQQFIFAFETDRGPLSVPAILYALPRHRLSPDPITLETRTDSDGGWTFELVHREVYRPGDLHPRAELRMPSEFSAPIASVKEGKVAWAPEFAYKDSTYRVKLEDYSLGLHKRVIALLSGTGRLPLVEVPVTWQRVSFLSSTPSRIILGAHPVRVFLRCPDERVELTRVVATPSGTKAVVSSPRELTVMVDDGVPDVIDGQVEVGTTSSGRPPLKIPVVRYAPARHTAAR